MPSNTTAVAPGTRCTCRSNRAGSVVRGTGCWVALSLSGMVIPGFLRAGAGVRHQYGAVSVLGLGDRSDQAGRPQVSPVRVDVREAVLPRVLAVHDVPASCYLVPGRPPRVLILVIHQNQVD